MQFSMTSVRPLHIGKIWMVQPCVQAPTQTRLKKDGQRLHKYYRRWSKTADILQQMVKDCRHAIICWRLGTCFMRQSQTEDTLHQTGKDHCYYSSFTNQYFHICAPYSLCKNYLLFLSAQSIIQDQWKEEKRKGVDSTENKKGMSKEI